MRKYEKNSIIDSFNSFYFSMKRTVKLLLAIFATYFLLALTSCGSWSNLTNNEAFKRGYNAGMYLQGGSTDDFLK